MTDDGISIKSYNYSYVPGPTPCSNVTSHAINKIYDRTFLSEMDCLCFQVTIRNTT